MLTLPVFKYAADPNCRWSLYNPAGCAYPRA